jgi:Flp pilus assembly protein TadG
MEPGSTPARPREIPASRRSKGGREGQALTEVGLSIVLFFAVVLGLVTFGHAFMVANMITHAARDGARLAATWPNRGNCGVLTDTAPISDRVKAEIAAIAADPFTITVSQAPTPAANAPCGSVPLAPTVQVNVNGCVAYVFPILPSFLGTRCPNGQLGFAVNRTVVFDDEGV